MRSGKSLFALAAFLALLSLAQAEELEMGTVTYQFFSKMHNQMETGLFRISYDDQADGFILLTAKAAGVVRLRLSPADVDKFRANLEKFVEWEKLAVANQVEIKKPLPDSAIPCKAEWDEKGTRYSASGMTISFDFLSRSKATHLLQISENPVKSSDGASTLSIDIVYLDKPAAFAFESVISPANVAAKRKARADQKAVEGLFK